MGHARGAPDVGDEVEVPEVEVLGVEVGVAPVARVVEEAEGSLIVKPMKASMVGSSCRSSHTGEVTLGDVRVLRSGKSSAVLRLAAKVGESRRMASGLATRARWVPLVPHCQRRSLV